MAHNGSTPGVPRDVIVVGASAGGVEALLKLLKGFKDLPAAMFVIVHVSAQSPSVLASILDRVAEVPVRVPADGDPIEHGHIYVAPPNRHMILEAGAVRVLRGPKENNHRPAVDPLFRTAAQVYGARVMAVVLSGALDDGTAGIVAVKQAGGYTVAQSDALYTGMPESAQAAVSLDAYVPLAEIRPLLEHPPAAAEGAIRMPTTDEQRPDDPTPPDAEQVSALTCPECAGTLWERTDTDVVRFRCRVGHSYNLESMVAAHTDSVEASIWAAVRALQERAALLDRTADRLEGRRPGMGARLRAQAEEARAQSRTVRQALLEMQDEAHDVQDQAHEAQQQVGG